MEENGHSSSSTARAAHIIGRLGGLIRVFSCPLLIILFANFGVEFFLKLIYCIKLLRLYFWLFWTLQENDEFFELISSKFLLETRYSTSIQAASGRLLLCCSLTWIVGFRFFLLVSFLF